QLSRVIHFLAVDLRDNVANLNASLRSRRIGIDLRYYCSHGGGISEELGVFRSDVVDGNSDSTVLHLAISNQLVDRRLYDLSWNREAHPGERAGRRDQERVDAHNLPTRIDQRSARVARIDGRVGLNKLTRLAAVRIRIRTVNGAHDSTRHREAESIRIAECQHRLPRTNLCRISPGNAREIRLAYLQDREVCDRVSAYQLRLQHAAIARGHPDVHRTLNHVIVGDDVAIGRNDHAAAQSMLNLRTVRLHLHMRPEELAKGAVLSILAEELLHVVRRLSRRTFRLAL